MTPNDDLELFASWRPDVDTVDDAAFEELRASIFGAGADLRGFTASPSALPVLVHLAHDQGRPRWRLVLASAVAAAAVVVVGLVAARADHTRPSTGATSSAVPPTVASSQPAGPTSTASSPSTAPDTTASTTPPVAYRPGLPVSPQDLIKTSQEWDLLVWQGLEAAAATCVAEHGLHYVRRPDPLPRTEIPYGPHDAEYRSTYGYGMPAGPRDTDQRWSAFYQQLKNPAINDLIIGTGDAQAGTCQARAYREIYPPDGSAAAPGQATLNQVQGDVFPRTLDNQPSFVAVTQAWSQCMTTNGYTYGTPVDAENATTAERVRQHPDEPQMELPPTADEVATALTDWQCQQSTGYADIYWGTLQTLTATVANTKADTITAIKSWQADVAARAHQAIDTAAARGA